MLDLAMATKLYKLASKLLYLSIPSLIISITFPLSPSLFTTFLTYLSISFLVPTGLTPCSIARMAFLALKRTSGELSLMKVARV